MTQEDLKNTLNTLASEADKLTGARKLAARAKIKNVEMQIRGVDLTTAAAKLTEIKLPSLEDMNAKIEAATNATDRQNKRANMIDDALNTIMKTLGIS